MTLESQAQRRNLAPPLFLAVQLHPLCATLGAVRTPLVTPLVSTVTVLPETSDDHSKTTHEQLIGLFKKTADTV